MIITFNDILLYLFFIFYLFLIYNIAVLLDKSSIRNKLSHSKEDFFFYRMKAFWIVSVSFLIGVLFGVPAGCIWAAVLVMLISDNSISVFFFLPLIVMLKIIFF